LKVEGLSRGVDNLRADPQSIRADIDQAKGRIACVLTRGAGKPAAESGLVRVFESDRLMLRKTGTRREARTGTQSHRSEQQQERQASAYASAGKQRSNSSGLKVVFDDNSGIAKESADTLSGIADANLERRRKRFINF
jgi:hypothetical protein